MLNGSCFFNYLQFKAGLCTTQKASRAKLSNIFYRGPQKSILFRRRDFVIPRKKFWNDNYIFEVEVLQHFVQLRKLSLAVRKSFTGHMRPAGSILYKPALKQHNFDFLLTTVEQFSLFIEQNKTWIGECGQKVYSKIVSTSTTALAA